MQRKRQERLPIPFTSLSSTNLTLPVLGLVEDGIPSVTASVIADDSLVIHLDHVLEEKFERFGNVRVISCGLYKPLPDHCVRFYGALLQQDAVDGVKQWRMATRHCRVNEGYTVRERQTHELTNLEKYSVTTFSAVTFCLMSFRASSSRRLSAIFPSRLVSKSKSTSVMTLTFSANTNTDLGEQEPIRWGSGGCGRGTPCDRIGEKAILPEYTKNKVARQLPGLPSVL